MAGKNIKQKVCLLEGIGNQLEVSNMEIKKVELENIRSYENAEIEFPSSSVLLSGDIGSGKSSVLLAIEFALFGLQKGALSGNSLLRNGKDLGRVKANFNIDGKDVVIERTLKRGKKSVSQESGYIIFDNEKREISTKEMKNHVLKLLNYPSEFLERNPELYRYTVYTPQEEMKQILLENSETRLNTLRRVFAMDKYKRIQENALIFLGKLRESMRNKEGMIFDLDSKKENLTERIKESKLIENSLKELNSQINSANDLLEEKRKVMADIENKSKEAESLNKELAVRDNTLSYKNNQLTSLKKNIADLEAEIKKYDIYILKAKDLFDDATRKISDKKVLIKKLNFDLVETSKRISSIETKKYSLDSLRRDVNKLDNCPTCKQKVSLEHKKQINEKSERETNELNTELEKQNKIKNDLYLMLGKNEEDLNELLNKERQLSKAESVISNLESKKKEMHELSEDIIKNTKKHSEIAKQLDSLKGIYEKCEQAKEEINSIREHKIEIEKKEVQQNTNLNSAEKIIEELKKEIENKEKIKETISVHNKIKDWLNEQFLPLILHIEKNVMLRLHHDFTIYFKKWFSSLSEGLTARLDENFTPIIEQAGYDIDYSYLSGGERTAAALAYRLSLNQVINSMLSHIKTRGLLILDEPTEGFSSEQLDKMKNVLQEINAKQIVLVSHESKIENFVDNIIRFEKDGHVSRVS